MNRHLLRPGQLVLRPGQLVLRPGQLVLRSGQRVLRPGRRVVPSTPWGQRVPSARWVSRLGRWASRLGRWASRLGRWVVARVRASGDGERGSAVVEFVTVGVLLLVPLVYLVLTMSRIQAASFAADSSARAAARSFVTAPNEASGRRRAEVAVDLGLRDQGFGDSRDRDVTLTCETPANCLTPGGQVQIEVEVRVVLPGIPRFLGRALSTDVAVRARQAAVVDEFRPIGDGTEPDTEIGPS